MPNSRNLVWERASENSDKNDYKKLDFCFCKNEFFKNIKFITFFPRGSAENSDYSVG